ncbi:hypothetical protein BC943DRAFT_364117 [Umbelopsis sp. AD052]|nr:hypothetical protein BC943DRAFT_364117 [Umbelopsis sp. AD052]
MDDYSFFNPLGYPPPSPHHTSPYLSPTVASHHRSEEDLLNSLSPDSAHRWQSQHQVASQPIDITSPFITPLDISPLLSPASYCSSDHFPGSGRSSPIDTTAWRSPVDAFLAMNTPVTMPSTTPPLLGSSYSSTSSALQSMDTPPSHNADIKTLIEASPFMTPSPIEQQEDLVLPIHAFRNGSPNATITSPISPTFSFTEDNNSVADLFHRFNIMEAQEPASPVQFKEKCEPVIPNFDFDPIPMPSHNSLGLPTLHIPRRSSSPCLNGADIDDIVSPTITVTPAGSDDGHVSDHGIASAPIPGSSNLAHYKSASRGGPKRHQRSHSANSLQTILGHSPPMPAVSTSSGSTRGGKQTQRQALRRNSSSSSRPFICRYCDFAFTREWNRKTHERLHDPNFVPEHQCNFCDKRFMRKHDCLRHMSSVHRDEGY